MSTQPPQECIAERQRDSSMLATNKAGAVFYKPCAHLQECKACRGTGNFYQRKDGQLSVAECQLGATQREYRRINEARFPWHYRDARIEQCQVPPQVQEACSGWKRSLWLAGSPGIGKTHLAVALARQAAQSGRSVLFYDTDMMLMDARAAFDGSTEDPVARCQQVDLLVLDDIDKARITDWSAGILHGLFRWRINRDLPMLVTANERATVWAKTLPHASHLVSRMHGHFVASTLAGPDRRR